jgi:hypothetical protein
MPNFEATLFNTLRDMASVTKVNLVQSLNTALADGTLVLDETTLHTITSIFSATVDTNIDAFHGQLLRISGPISQNTEKKTTE